MDVGVDARAVFDVVAATDVCDPRERSLKLQLISVPDRFARGIIRRMHWVDARDMLADGVTKVGIDRTLLHKALTDCQFKLEHHALTHTTTIGRLCYHSPRRRR